MHSYVKFPSQVYHWPMQHTKFIYFNISCTKTSYTVACYIVYSLEWNRQSKASWLTYTYHTMNI